MDRRAFLQTMGFGVVGAQLLTACGSYNSDYGSGNSAAGIRQGGNCTQKGTTADVQILHSPNHTVTVPAADVAAGVQKTYVLAANGSGHTHNITLTAAHFQSLQNGNGITVASDGSTHSHRVTVNCA